MTTSQSLQDINVTMSHYPYSAQMIAFGGAALSGEGKGYGFGPLNETEAERLLRASWDLGIRLYDTAPIYGYGLSEERMGRYLPAEARIVSKGGIDWHSNRRVNLDNRPSTLYRMFDESRRRLQRETLYAYLIHWPDPRQPIEGALEVLATLKAKKLIQFGGLCNADASDLAKTQQSGLLDYLQCEYSYLKPQPFTQRYPSLNESTTTMGWGTLAKGILTNRVSLNRRFHPEDARSWAPWWKKTPLKESLEQAQTFINLANDYQIKPVQLAIWHSWTIGQIHLPIVGFRSESDLADIASGWNKFIQFNSALTSYFQNN